MRLGLGLFLAAWLLALPAFALDAPRSSADVILTVDGDITVSNAETGAHFDRAMLREIGWREITTHSPFLEGPQTFSGVPIGDFLAFLGVVDGEIFATALDGYTVTLPVAEVVGWDALLAMEHNGREMRVRNRGPIWLIFPMSADEAAQGDAEGKMIWQVRSFTFRPNS